jgi:two-component system, CitB family, response regulator DctR
MSEGTHKFIIVDDEQEVRLSIRRVMTRCFESARIFEAASGLEALKLFESHGADLMIIDHHIPLLDGLSLVRFLRAQEVKIPLVLISNNPQIEKESAAAGATRFLDKRKLSESLAESLAGVVSLK